jgi:hypothetical protein
MKATLLFAAVAIAMVVETAHAQPDPNPKCLFLERQVVDIRGTADLDKLTTYLPQDNTIVRLGPDVDLDFSRFEDSAFPIKIGRCVILTSVASFDVRPERDPAGHILGFPSAAEARTPHSPGPALRHGPHRADKPNFLTISCEDDPVAGVRISGFRLYGPSLGDQNTDNYGIRIYGCIDVEISNMEIAGWGGAGIRVDNGGPSTHPQEILIHDNFIHHNQHPAEHWYGGHAGGYGVEVSYLSWAKIYQNVFDFNRHSIAASGDTGGYWAEHNLILRGGGYHGTFYNTYTHSFDVHGTGCSWSDNLCGDAGEQFWYYSNAWQYQKDNDIKIRGRPTICCAYIDNNIFPFSKKEDAINLYTTDNVNVGTHNIYNVDTFGQYGVCDFDADGVDDLFLATGATWWFSSFGEFPWSFLNAKTERLENLRFGYFDDDKRCDVLADRDGEWVISSGGTTDWRSLGTFGKPLSEVQFGRFDPRVRDHRPGVTRQTTHAFWRRSDGQWFVTPLSHPDWQPVQSSGFPMKALRFGDFTGDGVTDVLAVENGHWSISESATGQWSTLNPTLSDPVENLYIANMDPDDNIDDILRLDRKVQTHTENNIQYQHVELTWWRSKNGTEPWQKWRAYTFDYPLSPEIVPVYYGFAGRFGAAPGGGTMVIDHTRLGRFYSAAERLVGASPDWESQVRY